MTEPTSKPKRKPASTAAPPAFASDAARWRAVLERDGTADGQFVYAVRTTGVYCRPTCGARLAKRDNVSFHPTAIAAAAAGYRACRRCRPDAARAALAGPDAADSRRSALVAEACAVIAAAEEPPSLKALSAAVGLSPYHFHRLFKAATGLTPKAFIDAERARRVTAGLDAGETVTAAIHGAGYGSTSRFYERGQLRLGMTAGAYRRGGEGAAIRFAVGNCTLGAILVAATERGVCRIALGDDPAELLRDFEDRFPNARLIGADRTFERLVGRVIAAVDDPATAQTLPLDVRGTAFQERVWQALRAIPAGTTATYADIAGAIGMPRATRAVANACGANPLAVAIPCHRVVRTDGGLGGYRWGIGRKRALLAREAR